MTALSRPSALFSPPTFIAVCDCAGECGPLCELPEPGRYGLWSELPCAPSDGDQRSPSGVPLSAPAAKASFAMLHDVLAVSTLGCWHGNAASTFRAMMFRATTDSVLFHCRATLALSSSPTLAAVSVT
jgi:hypothetical protein